MKITKLLFLVAIVVTLGACTKKAAETGQENVKYYRNTLFSETPWDLERGSYPLTADEAKTINNYKFTWDDSKRLVSVEYNRNGVLLDYSSLRAAKITYTYEGDKQLKRYFNTKGEQISADGIYTAEYTLAPDGTRSALRFLNQGDSLIENRNKINNFVWTKLPDGMIRELRYNLAGESVVMNQFCPFYELRFSYDANGFVTRMANFDNDTLYNCTAENCGDIGVSYFLFQNNPNGDVLEFSVHNTTGQLSNLYWGWAKRVSVFDENGYAVEVIQLDQDNEPLGGKNIPTTKTVYDEHGALVERISLDAEKNIVNNPNSGIAITEYQYDELGNRVKTLNYDKDRKLIES